MTPEEALLIAVQAGINSPCCKSKRGVVIFNEHPLTGHLCTGWNSPPTGYTCTGTDTCRGNCSKVCVHAEQAALLQALACGHPVTGMSMLHVKVEHGKAVYGGPPSCVSCSKLILDSRLRYMYLLESTSMSVVRYTAAEFHQATLKNLGLLE